MIRIIAHRERHPGFRAARKPLSVLGEPAPRGEPGECALHHPPPCQDVDAAEPDVLSSDHRILWVPDTPQAAPRMRNDLEIPAGRFLDPLSEATPAVRAVRPHVWEPRNAPFERPHREFAAGLILEVGFLRQHLQDHSGQSNEQMLRAPLGCLPAVTEPRPPPFWLVVTA